ncbi:hypothetical protein BU23DRAFT_503770 [Bimuria novae-zelandiae CBS 107.79]|uniref:Histone deacetylase interacting domain-containing protein n=1 Tax=Bimuria novae-zelandiae CBS 107.79 TaxID=1447943 RepID=A0A6A5VDM8_9PLEO|nr:hypothetical protein BU23DRAFT_503770 [Bimuria novae-zelandiae CBS 107.79]
MNPAHRDGWPPTQAPAPASGQQQTEQSQGQPPRPLGSYGPSNSTQQPPSHASPAQGPPPVLPLPAGGPFYPSNGASQHNQSLPGLPGLTGQPPQASPHMATQRPPSSEAPPAPQTNQPAPQGPSYPLPGLSQTLQQPHGPVLNQATADRERELRERETREREMMESHAAQQHAAQQDELVKRETEQRERDARDRQQQQEQAAHENHSAPIQIHQPVAVAPSTRTVHGPNGLLGQSGPLGGPAMTAPNAPNNIFGGAAVQPIQQGDTTPRMQHAVQPPPQPSMLMPFAGPPGAAAAMAMGQGQQPILNDALSYLDQVKVQFADHPDVYNRFLDIMKDFKSGAIDTPGVIERVSTLFAGNPNLIQGFNTFLPPGYKIECGTNGDPNAIRVTTPMGTTVSTMPAPRPFSPRITNVNGNPAPTDSAYYDSQARWAQNLRDLRPPQAAEQQDPAFSPNNRNLGQPLFGPQQAQAGPAPLSPEATTRFHPDAAASAATLVHQQEQRGVSQLQNAVSAAAGRSIISPGGEVSTPLAGQALNGVAQGAQGGVGAEKRGPVEFNHAISYVNKIKNRFATQPDIYKQFLEILQTYQRESKPIQDVYAQVTSLFGGAPDLLEDFKQFLPESAAQHRAQQAARHNEETAMLGNSRGDAAYGQAPNHQQTPRADTSRLPPMGNFAPTPTANRDNKRKRGDRQGAGAAAAAMPTPMPQDVQQSSVRSTYGQGNANKRAKTGHAKQPMVVDAAPLSPTLIPAPPAPMPPTTTTNPSQEDLAFFDRVKKFIGNKNTMNEFLKLCNLYSQDLMDKNLLLYRAQSFIGGNQELYAWFKKFLGEEEEQPSLRPKTVNSRVSLSNCRSFGPSYRLLPKRERERLCSGRDELCRSVLNDEWASHPTWASEDSGFVAHRKNTFEEGLHRIEEERHDYDTNIEACNRTIQQLEPIATQLLAMKPEDRANFVLPPGLGGQSETIYKKVIMKIYGREKGAEVIHELFQMPWSVVPVLLHRLKAKLEDWKAAQREWEKVWRDQTQKIFWKSLDHQSLTVKANDKRQFQPKTLQNEIQVRYEEQKRLQEINEIRQDDYQFKFEFPDEDVLYDVAHLVLTYAENASSSDYSKVTPFIKEFVPLFFGIDSAKFEQHVQIFARESSTNGSGEDTPSADEDPSQRVQKYKKGDLRRDVLDPRGKSRKDKEDSVASVSRDSSPGGTSAGEEDPVAQSSNSATRDDRPAVTWVHHTTEQFDSQDPDPEEPYRRSEYNMYANQTIYCFFRMFVILYERLLAIKKREDEVRRIVSRAQTHKPADDLKMIDKKPSDFFKDTSEGANYYQQVLEMLQDQITGDADMAQIEETLRRYYLQVGWQLYSFDRLLGSLARMCGSIVTNDSKDKSLDIHNLFRKDRINDTTTHRAEIAYRKQVEKYIKDADTYRIAFDPNKMEAYVRLFKKDDPTFEFDQLDKVRRWRAYVASYMAVEPTEGLEFNKLRHPYLAKRLAKLEGVSDDDRFETLKSEDKITVSILPHNYTMKFLASEPFGIGGVQYFVQPDEIRAGVGSKEEYETLIESKKERVQELFVRNNEWMKNLSRDDVDERKAAFRKDLDEPRNADDVEMTDA